MSTQGRTERIANSAHDEAALSGYVADINEALTDYQVSLNRVKIHTLLKQWVGIFATAIASDWNQHPGFR